VTVLVDPNTNCPIDPDKVADVNDGVVALVPSTMAPLDEYINLPFTRAVDELVPPDAIFKGVPNVNPPFIVCPLFEAPRMKLVLDPASGIVYVILVAGAVADMVVVLVVPNIN